MLNIYAFPDTAELQYKKSLQLAEELLGRGQINLLKLSLSLHNLSPKVQAHLQIANEVQKTSPCITETFVDIGGRIVCDISEIDANLNKKELSKISVYNLDHVYSGSENNTQTVVLYSLLGTQSFEQFHDKLKKKADAGDIRYIFRHNLKVCN